MSLLYIRRRLTHALQTLARYLGAPPASPTPLTSEWISTRCEGLDASAAVVVEVALDEESGENGAVARVALGGERLVVKRPPASPAARAVAAIQQWYAREAVWTSKFYGAFFASTSTPSTRRLLSTAWRCRFLTAPRRQHGRVIAEK